MPDDDGKAWEYYNCPVAFLIPRVVEWSREYHAIKSGISAPDKYGDMDSWFNTARVYYEGWYNYMMRRKNKHG